MLLAILLLSAFATAQLRDRTEHPQRPGQPQAQKQERDKRGPRAIAVVEFLPGGGARLVPIALWINDRFYDASLYGANPEPMALQPETLYQALNYGEPTGWFTVTTPERGQRQLGRRGTMEAANAVRRKIAQQAAKQPNRSRRRQTCSATIRAAGAAPPSIKRASSPSGAREAPSPAEFDFSDEREFDRQQQSSAAAR